MFLLNNEQCTLDELIGEVKMLGAQDAKQEDRSRKPKVRSQKRRWEMHVAMYRTIFELQLND
jgi:hypothetical protein